MRILYVSEAFGGGVFETIRLLAQGAVDQGHSVAIAYGVRPETPDSLREHLDDQVELFPMPWTRRTATAQLEAFFRFRSVMDEWKPDVVHLQSSFAGIVGALAANGVPVIYSPQAYTSGIWEGGFLRRSAFRAAERFVSRRVTIVGAVSHSEALLARRLTGARHVTVIENGVPELDANRLVERDPPASPLVVAVGRTVPQRQPEACARILSGVGDIAEVAWIGGGGGDQGRRGWVALERAGIQPTGWLPREQVLERLGRASAYLHWTAWDGLPLSALEAMALDVPVVASDIEPNREVLGPKQVCSTEEEAIALLRKLLTDREFAKGLLASQRRRRLRYGARRMVREWLDLYESLLRPGAPML